MFRDEVATCTSLVAQVRVICEFSIEDEAMRVRATEALDEVLDILTRPSELSEDGQRAKWRDQKRRQRLRKKNGEPYEPDEVVRGLSVDIPLTTVGEEEAVVVEVEAAAAEDPPDAWAVARNQARARWKETGA